MPEPDDPEASDSEPHDPEFAAWYRENYRRVVAATLLVTGDRALAEDVVDEAFARAYERWSRVHAMDSPTGWTCVVARNALRTAHRKERRLARALHLLPAPSEPSIELAVEVWDAVRSLSRRQREVTALRYLAGLHEREIADVLGIAPGTVARTLHDARAALAQLLGEPSRVEESDNA